MTDTRAFRQVWAAAAAGGFLLGIGNGGLQVAVESGQVLAGLVKYPETNPFYIYHLKLWTVTTQLAALMLRAGLSEIAASHVLSGLLGAVSFSALTLVVFAVTRDRLFSLLVPVFIHLTPAPQVGVSYPIWIVGSPHTFGAMGLSFALLVLALLACGRYRPGLALLAFAPAVHASLGAWLWMAAGLALLSGLESRTAVRREWRFFVAGGALTALSLAAHLPGRWSVPKPSVDVAPYFETFVREWDGHRAPVDLGSHGLLVSLAAGVIALAWLLAFRDEIPEPARVLLRALAVGSALAVPIVAISFADPAHLPPGLVSLMPARAMNVNVLASTPLLFALLWRGRAARIALVLLLLAVLLPAPRSRYVALLQEGWPSAQAWPIDRVTSLASVAGLLLVVAWWERRHAADVSGPVLRRAALALLWTAPVVALALVLLHPPQPRDRTNNRLFAELAQGEGLVATPADVQLVQLRSRRPVLLDGGGLDALPYAVESGPEMARLLLRVYDIDFFYPPPEARRRARIPEVHNRTVWEARTRDEWKAIRKELGVRHVLALRDWELDLPASAGSRELRIYEIPE